MWGRGPTAFFCCMWMSSYFNSTCWKDYSFLHWIVLVLVDNQLTINMRIYFCIPNLLPLICMSILMLEPDHLFLLQICSKFHNQKSVISTWILGLVCQSLLRFDRGCVESIDQFVNSKNSSASLKENNSTSSGTWIWNVFIQVFHFFQQYFVVLRV